MISDVVWVNNQVQKRNTVRAAAAAISFKTNGFDNMLRMCDVLFSVIYQQHVTCSFQLLIYYSIFNVDGLICFLMIFNVHDVFFQTQIEATDTDTIVPTFQRIYFTILVRNFCFNLFFGRKQF